MRRKVSTTVYLEPEQVEALHLLSEATKVPIAVYIRQGIDSVIKSRQGAIDAQRMKRPFEQPGPP